MGVCYLLTSISLFAGLIQSSDTSFLPELMLGTRILGEELPTVTMAYPVHRTMM